MAAHKGIRSKAYEKFYIYSFCISNEHTHHVNLMQHTTVSKKEVCQNTTTKKLECYIYVCHYYSA